MDLRTACTRASLDAFDTAALAVRTAVRAEGPPAVERGMRRGTGKVGNSGEPQTLSSSHIARGLRSAHDSTGRMKRCALLMPVPTMRAGASSPPLAAMTAGVAGACRTLTGCGGGRRGAQWSCQAVERAGWCVKAAGPRSSRAAAEARRRTACFSSERTSFLPP